MSLVKMYHLHQIVSNTLIIKIEMLGMNKRTNESKDGYEVLVAEPEVVVGRETEHGSHVVIETVDPIHPTDGNTLAHGHPEQGNATGGVSVVEFE